MRERGGQLLCDIISFLFGVLVTFSVIPFYNFCHCTSAIGILINTTPVSISFSCPFLVACGITVTFGDFIRTCQIIHVLRSFL